MATYILGLNAHHGEASACLVRDGEIIAAVEEERFTRVKYTAGFPRQAVRFCLEAAGISVRELEHIAVARKPGAHLREKVLYTLRRRPSWRLVTNSLARTRHTLSLQDQIAEACGVRVEEVKARLHFVEHHLAHCASAYAVSGYPDAAVLSVDGFGDFLSGMLMDAEGNTTRILDMITFPHSLGVFYTAMTQYCGFLRYGDEWKLMGLSAYGQPEYLEEMRQIIRRTPRAFELNLDYFRHHKEPIYQHWDKQVPVQDIVYSDLLIKRLGPAREPGATMTAHYEHVASSAQAVTEEVLLHLVNRLQHITRRQRLCLAGGVALNSLFNGKIMLQTAFKDVFIQPAAGDAGLSLGAAMHVQHSELDRPRTYVMRHAYLGPAYSAEEIQRTIERYGLRAEHMAEDDLVIAAAAVVADGGILGWFQGAMEFGPRALGNRSIVADPRRAELKDILNERIKRREAFRPFAPSILLEAVGEYFEQSYPEPFMVKVYVVREEKRSIIPAVTHVDGTGRLQTVDQETNPRYWKLIKAFENITGVPVVLNTSFNENEPIVTKPEEAIDCFLRTKMDCLVLGEFLLRKEWVEQNSAVS